MGLSIDQLIDKMKGYKPALDERRVKKAFDFASQIHKEQYRYSGDPYITHPLEVTDILLSLKPDEDTVIASLLHDVYKSEHFRPQEIEKEFGKGVATLVSGLEKLNSVRSREDETQIDSLRKMFLAMAQDLRVVLIKLADRLHNMQTLQFVHPSKRKRIARETLDIYAPIASRLGIYALKSQLEDLAFKYLYPEQYQEISVQLEAFGKRTGEYIQQTNERLDQFLKEHQIEGTVQGRLKSVYSIYRKLKRKNKSSVTDLFDVFAMRMVLPTAYQGEYEFTGHLYQSLGLLHGQWVPLANRFKDYIAVPKPNGYQSLHTTVIGLAPKALNHPVEVQICSERMHRENEYGIASHWLYEDTDAVSTKFQKDVFLNYLQKKDQSVLLDEKYLKRQLDWLKGLEKLQAEMIGTGNSSELLENLKVDLFSDRIFVLTPTGEVKDLPFGATPVDFAYAVHSDVGHRCGMAKVNGSIVPLNYQLKNGEVVEIVLKPKQNPKLEWLSFVKTNIARQHIKSWFNAQDRELGFKEGKELLNKQLRRLGKSPLDEELSILRNYEGKELSLKERRKIVDSVGNGSQFANIVVKKIFSDVFVPAEKEKVAEKKIEGPREKRVLLGGEAGLPVRFAACCAPKEKDRIVGYVTRGHAASVHRTDCLTLTALNPARILEAKWDDDAQKKIKHDIRILIEAVDRIGLIRDVTTVIANMNVNISDFALKSRKDNIVVRSLQIKLFDYEQFDLLVSQLENVKGVIRVMREDVKSQG